ncbi:T9SS type A sorting domain-containing protein [bacterium]|nr:T9SS type A sorting domain-containing protein [bacterium]MBU1650841.1 T9SS type A sorting domain-containing protein [bacterium]
MNPFIKTFQFVLITASFLTLSTSSVFGLDYVESSGGLADPQWEGGHSEIEMADVDLDGNVDLVAIGDHGSPYINTQEHGVMVYFGDGTGRFSVFQNGNFGYGGCCIGDVNGDGLQDIGYGMHHNYSSNDFGDQLIEVALGDGTGQNWTPWDDGLASQGEDWGMFACDFGDVDNDGDLDIASTSFGSGNPLMIYLNNGDGTWTHSASLSGSNPDMVVFFGDINKDGNLDVASAYQNGSLFFGNGDGTFYDAMYNLPTGGSAGLDGLSLGDVDNDGGMDLSYIDGGGVYVWVFDESSTQWIDYTNNLPVGGLEYSYLYDMNVDGFCDVVAGGSGNVEVWTGDGAGNWTRAANYTIWNDPDCDFETMNVGGDVDHNGYPDIVHLTDEGSWINSYNHLRCYRESSMPTVLTCTPLFPKGGEVFPVGSERFTDWVSAVPGGQASTVDIELSTSGSSGPWDFIGAGLPNNGRLQWTIPQAASSTDCFLRYTVVAGGDTVVTTTPAPFIILGGALNLTIDLEPVNPPIIIPAGGGSFDFDISVMNSESVPIGCSVWIDVTLPGGTIFGPLINVPATAPVGIIERTKTQVVPGNAPAGQYSYNAYVGIYPSSVWSSASFDFEKSASDDNGAWISNWWTDFDGFEEAELITTAPDQYEIVQIYPNPFNPSTAISIQLSAFSHVNLAVYDITGRKVATLIDGYRDIGMHEVIFDATDLPSGVYLYRFESGSNIESGKIVLLK